MNYVTKEVLTETAHRLLHHRGKCRYLHGHTYKWQVTVTANDVNDHGMVVDFSILKEFMENIIVGSFDHATVLNTEDPLIPALQMNGQNVLRMSSEPTAEEMAVTVYDLMSDEFNQYHSALGNKDIPVIKVHSVKVWETPTSFACYKGESI